MLATNPVACVSWTQMTALPHTCPCTYFSCSVSPAEFSTVVKRDTAVVAGDVMAKTKATVEENFNKASAVASLAVK